MKVINTYIVTCKSKVYPGDYTTVLYECEDSWYAFYRSAFSPGLIGTGLNGISKVDEREALEMLENSKITRNQVMEVFPLLLEKPKL